jgi:hypothetical protein
VYACVVKGDDDAHAVVLQPNNMRGDKRQESQGKQQGRKRRRKLEPKKKK